MNYKSIYDNLINKALNRNLKEYGENHHIIPSCIGGSDDQSNFAKLTPEEHYLAHQLLVKIYPNHSNLIYAAKMMTISTKNADRSRNKLYGWLKRRFSEDQKNKIVSDETKHKMSESAKKRERITCPHCGKSGISSNMNRWHFDNCSKGPNKTIHSISEEHKRKIKEGSKTAVHLIIECPHCGKSGKECVINTHIKFCKSNPNRIKKVDTKIKCPHCNKIGTVGNMNRWHFNNCKNKPR